MKDLMTKLEIEMAIKHERNMLPEFKMLSKITAEKQKIYFDELITAGFNHSQALAIVKEHGTDIGRNSWINFSKDKEDEEGE